jgi:hypothetical protein
MYIEASYLIYLVISLSVTVWVARTLYKNGRVFLIDAFHGDAHLADSINRLLVVAFYLINAGYVAYALSTDRRVDTLRAAIELVSEKIGAILLLLGVMHLLNFYLLTAFGTVRKPRSEVTNQHG